MPQAEVHAFLQALGAPGRQALHRIASQPARQPMPAGWIRWSLGAHHLGCMAPERADWLASQLPACRRQGATMDWAADEASPAQRSEALQAALLQARAQGLLQGWRDERFSFWDTACADPDPGRPALFAVERAGFRFLGLLSHAVHVNAFAPDGRLWCARRALHKATDPGMLDNMTAGGLPAGETTGGCLHRELAEEAGLLDLRQHRWAAVGRLRTTRREPQGWHDEFIHVYNLGLAEGFVPRNQDGEVAEFMCLAAPEVLGRMQGGEFTVDAALSLLRGLGF